MNSWRAAESPEPDCSGWNPSLLMGDEAFSPSLPVFPLCRRDSGVGAHWMAWLWSSLQNAVEKSQVQFYGRMYSHFRLQADCRKIKRKKVASPDWLTGAY